MATQGEAPDNRNKKAIFKNCAPLKIPNKIFETNSSFYVE